MRAIPTRTHEITAFHLFAHGRALDVLADVVVNR